jgi:hypothetical protein
LSGAWESSMNGFYTRNGQYYKNYPVFTNGTWYLWLVQESYYVCQHFWTVSSTVGSYGYGNWLEMDLPCRWTPEGTYTYFPGSRVGAVLAIC